MKIDDFLDSQEPTTKRAGAVRIDSFLDQPSAPTNAPTNNLGAGIASRALGIVGDLIQGTARIGEQGGDYLERKIPLSGLSESQIQERQLEPLFRAAEWFKRQQQAINYQPSVDFQQIKQDPLNLPQTGKFIVEQGVGSIPDMAAAMVNLPGYILSRTNSVADERAKNEGRAGDVNLGDMAKAAPGAIVEATLERFATGRLLPGKVTGGSIPARIGKQVGIQAGTEGVEEVAGYAGETAGTQAGFNPNDALDRFLAGALVGGPMGGTVQGGAEVVNRIMGSPKVAPEVAPDTVQQTPLKAGSKTQEPQEPSVADLMDLIRDTALTESRLQTPPSIEQAAEPSIEAFLDSETLTPDSVTQAPITVTQEPQSVAPAQQTESVLEQDLPVTPEQVVSAVTDSLDLNALQTTQPSAQPSVMDAVLPTPEPTIAPAPIEAPSASTQAQPLSTVQKAQAQIPAQIAAPAYIDLERAKQVLEAQPGMRPGDIMGAKGAPFKNKSAAQKVAKEAGPGWRIARSNGGFVVRHQPASDKQIANAKRQVAAQRSIDSERDSMFAAIAKLGGLNRDQLIKEWGADPADLKNLYGAGILRVATTKGMKLDRMAESLAELGYLSLDANGKHDLAEFDELFFNELAGSPHYTPEGWMRQAQAQEAARYEEYLSEQDAKAAGLDQASEQDQEDTSEFFGEPQELTEADYARLEQEAIDWEQSAAQQDTIIDNADETIDERGGRMDQADERIESDAGREGQGDTNPDQTGQAAGQEQNGVREEGARSPRPTEEGFQLEGETEREIREREERDAARRKADEQKEREAQNRVKADEERNTFSLTGSDRAADVQAAQGQQGLFESNTKPSKAAAPAVDLLESQPVENARIEDFGEKLGGARKDKALSLSKAYSDDEIASQPFSKIWPAAEIDAIEDNFVAAVATTARAEVPAKPRAPYKVKRWVEKVKSVRELAAMINDGKVTKELFVNKLSGIQGLDQFRAKVALLEAIDRTQWNRIGAVAEYPNAYRYEGENKISTPVVRVEIDGRTVHFDGAKTVADAIERVNERLGTPKQDKKMQFEIRRMTKTGEYFINKKGDREYRKLKTFKTAEEAREYRDNNYEELVAAWEGVKESDNVKKSDVRGDENRPRTGADHRQGKDVSAEKFGDTFGFRGVEFGNWVAQGANAKERQGMLNQAYDALLDLAEIVGVPPKAISLNGSLGLGFGSRGSGNASAHFEPDTLVINLTKTKGAGSLAHEWFHALDNYFARMRNPAVAISQEGYRQANFITYRPEPMLIHKDNPRSPLTKAQLERYREQNPKSDYFKAENWKLDPAHPQGVRPEIETAFADLVKALDDSPMKQRAMSNDKGEDGYWSRIIERGARSFENYVISKMMEKGYNNDYLANVRSVEDFPRSRERYPYLLPEEVAPIAQAFDELFAVVETKPTEKGMAIFSASNDPAPKSQWLSESAIAQVIEERLSKFAYQPPILIRDSVTDLFPGFETYQRVQGVSMGGRIYLFRDGLGSSRAELIKTLWHELLHHGIRRFMTQDQYIAATKKLYAADSWIKEQADAWKATDYGKEIQARYGEDYATARGVDEALADLAEETQGELNQSIKARVIRAVQRWIAFLADRFGFTDMANKWRGYSNEEANALIKQIFSKLQDGDAPVDGNSGFFADPSFSMKDPANPQEDLDLPPAGERFEPIAVRDFVSVEKNAAGRREYVAGRKLYDRLSTYATNYLGTLKLADTKPDAFKQMMRQFKVDQVKSNQTAKQIAESGRDLSPEQREMISDMMEKQLKAGDVPPQEMIELASTMAAALDVQARELVDLGMLTEDRLVKNYLPRLYQHGLAAKLTNPAMLQSWFTKARMKIRGDRLKSRGMFAEMATGKVAQAKKLGWNVSSMTDGSQVPQELFEAFDKSQPIPPNYQDAKVLMWRDYTENERAEMGEVRDGVLRYAMGYVETQKDIAIGRLFKAIAQNPELAKTHNPGGWVQVPTNEIKVRPDTPGVKAYGALAGMYVDPQVADALKRNTQPKGILMAMYDKALNFWKEGKTVWNPGAHVNNVVSNLFTAYFAGVNPASPARWRETLREYRTKGKYYTEALDNGLFGNEWANQEIQDLLMPDFNAMADIESVATSRVAKTIEFAKKYPGRPISVYREKMQKAYEFEDQFFKLMLFIDRRKSGMSAQDAINDTERYVFNYSDMPEGVELIKRTYSPFFAYTYKAIPMVLHTAMTRPDRLLAPIVLLGGANWLAYAITGGDEDKERKGMPEYMRGRTVIGTPKAVRMPFDVEDKPAFMDMSRRVPLGDLFDINNQTNGLPVPAPFMPSHPVISIMQAVIYNQDTFTGKDLVKKSDTAWEAAQARSGYLFRQFTPNAPFIPGSYNFNKLADATAHTFDTEIGPYTGRTKAGDAIPLITTLPDVLTGTKIRSFDPERGLEYQGAALGKEEREIRANIRSAGRNQSMSEGAKAKYVQEQQDKLRELSRKREELRE